MEFTEMEKRMLYQTEGTERYAVMQEMAMASQYAGDPARRKAAKSLMEKLRPLTDAGCMEIVHDIQGNYRLPQEGRTIGELLAQARQKSGAEQLKGHDIMALERFDPEVKHMIVFDVLSGNAPVGDKGDKMRLFLTDATPQGLRNVLLISATPYQWKHIIGQRICRRNTDETRIVLLKIWQELYRLSPSLFSVQLTGTFCQRDKCLEGKMRCGKKLGASQGPSEILAADYPALFKGGAT